MKLKIKLADKVLTMDEPKPSVIHTSETRTYSQATQNLPVHKCVHTVLMQPPTISGTELTSAEVSAVKDKIGHALTDQITKVNVLKIRPTNNGKIALDLATKKLSNSI